MEFLINYEVKPPKYHHTNRKIQRIQVERLMMSVFAFIITVDWLRCEANCQTLLGGG